MLGSRGMECSGDCVMGNDDAVMMVIRARIDILMWDVGMRMRCDSDGEEKKKNSEQVLTFAAYSLTW